MPGVIRSFKDLDVWNVAMELAVACYETTKSFPRSEQFGLTAQIRGAAVSVSANIAEGHGRFARREFLQFIRIARGSLSELEAELVISRRLGYLAPDAAASLEGLMKRCTSMLVRLAKSLDRKAANARARTV